MFGIRLIVILKCVPMGLTLESDKFYNLESSYLYSTNFIILQSLLSLEYIFKKYKECL
jgi:hypothetical protein